MNDLDSPDFKNELIHIIDAHGIQSTAWRTQSTCDQQVSVLRLKHSSFSFDFHLIRSELGEVILQIETDKWSIAPDSLFISSFPLFIQ